jgi:hypothetical protein
MAQDRRAREPRREVRRRARGLLLDNLEGDLLSSPTLAAIAADLRHCAGAAQSLRRAALEDVAEIDRHLRGRRLYGDRR